MELLLEKLFVNLQIMNLIHIRWDMYSKYKLK